MYTSVVTLRVAHLGEYRLGAGGNHYGVSINDTYGEGLTLEEGLTGQAVRSRCSQDISYKKKSGPSLPQA